MYPVQIPTFDCAGKTAVITGAGSGIGQAAAMLFAAYGANVVAADISEAAAEKTAQVIRRNGGRVHVIPVDIAQSGQVDRLIDEDGRPFWRCGYFRCQCWNRRCSPPLLEQTEEEFMNVVSVNLKDTFLCAKAAAKQMIHQGRGGRIVITASIGAFEGGGHHGPYGASKGALVTLVRTMGREWAEYGITVNAVCPGLTATAINQGLLEDKALAEALLDKIPMHRMAQPEEIASPCCIWQPMPAAFIHRNHIDRRRRLRPQEDNQ